MQLEGSREGLGGACWGLRGSGRERVLALRRQRVCRPQLSERVQLHTAGVRRAGEGPGRPATARASAWASQAGSRPGDRGRQGGRRSRVRSLCGGRAPLKTSCPGRGPIRRPALAGPRPALDVAPLRPPCPGWAPPCPGRGLAALPSEPPQPLFQSCFWGHCLARNSGQQPQSPRLPRCPGRWASYLRGQPTARHTHTPHLAQGTSHMAPADTMQPSPTVGPSWQLPVLSALSQPGNLLSRARPSAAKGQMRREKPQAQEEPAATAAPRAFEGRILHWLAFVLSSRQRHWRC